MLRSCLAAALAALALLAAPSPALARDDVRVAGSCGRGASAELRAEADDGRIEVELRVRRARSGERWRVAIVHERRVAWRGRARTRGGRGLRVRRELPDYRGADQVVVRASGPRGLTCTASATLPGR